MLGLHGYSRHRQWLVPSTVIAAAARTDRPVPLPLQSSTAIQ